MDRYLAVVGDAGAVPVVVLTKADMLPPDELRATVERVKSYSPHVTVVAVSSFTGMGVIELRQLLKPRTTTIAVGSSGVGKSTLLNVLMGDEVMATSAVRENDQRGRHTTTHRQLFALPDGALFVDTPGLREMGLFSFDAIDAAFADIHELAASCRFRDCSHQDEPGCAVKAAMRSGELTGTDGRATSNFRLNNASIVQRNFFSTGKSPRHASSVTRFTTRTFSVAGMTVSR